MTRREIIVYVVVQGLGQGLAQLALAMFRGLVARGDPRAFPIVMVCLVMVLAVMTLVASKLTKWQVDADETDARREADRRGFGYRRAP